MKNTKIQIACAIASKTLAVKWC